MKNEKLQNMSDEKIKAWCGTMAKIDNMKEYFRSEFRHFLILQAENGNAEAQFKLAERYFSPFDEFFEVDDEKAYYWYEKAALQDHPDAQRMLGICYLNGYGIEEDYEKGMSWLMRAADNNDDRAMVNVAQMLLGDKSSEEENKKAVEYLQKAELINREAAYYLAICHLKGLGVNKNIGKAIEYLKDIDECQDPNGAYKLAEIYEQGEYAEQDVEKALGWYKRAAELVVVKHNRHQTWEI